MTSDSQFQVFKTGPYYKLGTIYAVVTGSKSKDCSHIDTEWYYYVKDKQHKNCGFKISSEGAFKSIESFWDYTIESLKDAIYYEEIVPVLEEIKDYSFYSKVELQEIKPENLIYLSVENMEFINYLKKLSNCDELKKLVDFLPLIKIEKKRIE